MRRRAKDEKIHSYYQVLGLALKRALIEKGVLHRRRNPPRPSSFAIPITPAMGAKIVARAWTDPAYKKRLLADGTEAVKEFGLDMGALHLDRGREHAQGPQHDRVHAMLLLSARGAGLAALLVQEPRIPFARGARAARSARGIRHRMLPESVEVRVHDSTADMRYLVLADAARRAPRR